MDLHYIDQSRLVVSVLPFVAREGDFALKGGTAINLFESNLPRLSVDIDLAFVPLTERAVAIREINAALERICIALNGAGFSARLSGSDVARKIICSRGQSVIKIEPNFILRGTLFPIRVMEICSEAEDLLGYCRVNVLSRAELYGGKFCAALDRQHPRDLFDVAQFFARGGTAEEVKSGFISLALGHNRPLHEVLSPNRLDQVDAFATQFAGMSDMAFTYDEHIATFERLVSEINASLTVLDREHLVAFTALEADADVFGIPGLEHLPAIRWKRHNLQVLRQSDPSKFTETVNALKRTLA